MELPDSLKHAIEVRLRARGEDACAIACALALEPAATSDDLTDVLQMSEPQAFKAIDDLLELATIHQPKNGPQFIFAHDLIREIAATALNVGRRTALHRGFARRLEGSLEHDAAMRRARHLARSNQQIAAAATYAQAATEALQANAARDAIERCLEGVRAVDRLEEKPQRSEVLAKLTMLIAAGAATSGDIDGAIEPVNQSVAQARSSGDAALIAEALLLRAAILNARFEAQAARTDAENAAQAARRCGDQELISEALVRKATASRYLGEGAEAIAAAREAYEVSLSTLHGDESRQSALEELLRDQLSWLFLDEALKTSKRAFEEVSREQSTGFASLLQARSALHYMLGRYDAALRDIDQALAMANAVGRSRRPLAAQVWPALVLFSCRYTRGLIACANGRWNEALEQVESMKKLPGIAGLPGHKDCLVLLQIDGLLGRGSGDDARTAAVLAGGLADESVARANIISAACSSLARARVAIRLRDSNAVPLLRHALDALEENARRMPAEADRAFDQLAAAAAEIGDDSIRTRALSRHDHYRARRIAAAGTAWGAAPVHAG
jgi:tetratricopeptide (TPR) repeat protein